MNKLALAALTGWAATTAASLAIAFGGDNGTAHDIAANVAAAAIVAPVIAAGRWGLKNLLKERRAEN